MPDLTVKQNIPSDQMDRIVAAFVERQGPIPLDEEGNPTMTPAQFARQKIWDFVKNVVLISEREVAAKVVADAAALKAHDDFKNL